MKEDLNGDLWRFHIAFRELIKLPEAELARHGLTRIHNRILFVIARAGEISVGEISDRLEISRQALHGPMRKLRDAKLIASRPSGENRTVQLVSLTKAGERLEYKLNEVQREHLRLAFERVGVRGKDGWRQVMQAIAEIRVEEG